MYRNPNITVNIKLFRIGRIWQVVLIFNMNNIPNLSTSLKTGPQAKGSLTLTLTDTGKPIPYRYKRITIQGYFLVSTHAICDAQLSACCNIFLLRFQISPPKLNFGF